MKNARWIGLVFISLTGLAAAQSRILMLGNSITKGAGSTSGVGFRQMLYDRLKSMHYDFEFVGPSGDQDHLKGYFIPGASIGQFYSGPGGTGQYDVADVLNTYRPHIVMIHLGTNDLYSDDAIGPYSLDSGATFEDTTICGRLAYLCAKILEWHSGVRDTCVQMLFVSAIIPRIGHERRCLGFYNTVYYNIEGHSFQGRIPTIPPNTFRTVDQYNSFDTATMMSPEGVHPNDAGYEHMATVYSNFWRFFPLQYFAVCPTVYSGKKTGDEIDLGVRVLKGTGAAFSGMQVRFKIEEGPAEFKIPGQYVTTNADGLVGKIIRVTGEGVIRVSATVESTINKSITFTVYAQDHVFVQGGVAYMAENRAVPNTVIEWVEGAASVDTTDAAGYFGASRIPLAVDFTVRPWKARWSDVTPASILSYDASLIARHVVGLEDLAAEARHAADVNADDSVDMMDALYIGRYAAGIPLPESVHLGEWTFSPETREHAATTDTVTFPAFTATLTGDVKGGWQSDFPKSTPTPWQVIPVAERSGDTLSVLLQIAEADWLSADFTYRYDPTVLRMISADRSQTADGFQFFHRSVEPGQGRAGLFGVHPARGGAAKIRFRVMRSELPIRIEFDPVFVEEVRMDPVDVLIESQRPAHPNRTALYPNYPNPFNAGTVLSCTLTEPGRVRLDVRNTLGQQIACLIDGRLGAGAHSIRWDGTDDRGRAAPSGVYILTLQTPTERLVRKINLIR